MQNIFGFIIHPMELGLIWLAIAVGSAGIGIILFTIFVRLVLAPLNIVQLRSARAMQKLQPKIAELRKKHGKDREALSKATMELYKEHNVNPAMGCLPMLLQFPILIGLFYGLMHLGTSPSGYPKHTVYHNVFCGTNNSVHITNMHNWLQYCYRIASQTGHPSQVFALFHAHFLWLSNGLGAHDPLFILPILAGASQWIQSRMTLTKSVDPQQQMMNTMMNFMPLMIVFFAANYASGLSLYWVASTLIGIAIQYKITGWGLLPETVQGLAARFGLATAPSSAARKPAPARALQSTKQKTLEAATTSPEEVEPNGAEGDGAKPRQTASAARRRKKANRARGGRGGRRG